MTEKMGELLLPVKAGLLRSVVSPAASVYVGSSSQGQLKYNAPLLGQQQVFRLKTILKSINTI